MGLAERGVELSEDQREALDALLRALDRGEKELVLTGMPGTGKSTIMEAFAEEVEKRGRTLWFSAPTGRAAVRLGRAVQQAACTMHSLLYAQVAEDPFGKPLFSGEKNKLSPGDVLIVDEASMIAESLHRDLMKQVPRGAQVVFVGDREQLKPVDGHWGVNFDDPTAVLTRIHRQAEGNPIRDASRAVQSGGKIPAGSPDSPFFKTTATIDTAADWLADLHKQGADAILLCWTRATRTALNDRTRDKLGLYDTSLETGMDVAVGDRLRISLNNSALNLWNGELVMVRALERSEANPEVLDATVETETGRQLYIGIIEGCVGSGVNEFKDAASRLAATRDNSHPSRGDLAHVDFGWAVTVHAGQGSQWDYVGFVFDVATRKLAGRDPSEARRLVYTAITRAQRVCRVFDVTKPPKVSAVRETKVVTPLGQAEAKIAELTREVARLTAENEQLRAENDRKQRKIDDAIQVGIRAGIFFEDQ